MKLPDTLTNSDRMRFLKEYLAENKVSDKEKTVLIKRILKRTNKRLSDERMVRRELRKCLRTNARYLRIKAGKYHAVFDRDFSRDVEPLDFIEQIDAMITRGQVIKNGKTSDVSRLRRNGWDVVAKRYNHKGFVHSLRHTMKRSRARQGWLHAHRLRLLDIPTPRPLVYIEQRRGMLIWQCYSVTEYIEGQKLSDFLRDSDVSKEKRLETIQKIKRLIEKLGKYRITHGDLKHTNILITDKGPVLTDLDGMKVHRWSWWFKINRDKDIIRLGRLHQVFSD
jgi:tRNA A-37 threonylcarbamoyl transferase component Bud32